MVSSVNVNSMESGVVVLTDAAIRKKVQTFLNSARETERAQRGEPYSERDLTRAAIRFVNDNDPAAIYILLHGFAPDRFVFNDGKMRDVRPAKVDGEHKGHTEHAALRAKAHSFLCRHIDGDVENSDLRRCCEARRSGASVSIW
jgi:hypothetical protein